MSVFKQYLPIRARQTMEGIGTWLCYSNVSSYGTVFAFFRRESPSSANDRVDGDDHSKVRVKLHS